MKASRKGEPPGMILKAIGTVRNDVTQPSKQVWEKVVSEIEIDSRLTEALDGLERFSHIIVLCWMHLTAGEVLTKVHPMGKQDLPLVGLFATRTPLRPNPIGETVVKLLECQGNMLRVEGLDAINGTPVIDIKPYIPERYSADEVKVPPWIANH